MTVYQGWTKITSDLRSYPPLDTDVLVCRRGRRGTRLCVLRHHPYSRELCWDPHDTEYDSTFDVTAGDMWMPVPTVEMSDG